MANFTLSFNKVAAGLHLQGAKGVRVRMDGGNAQFQPTTDYAEDVLHLEERTRGGLEIRFKGMLGDQFLAATGMQPGDHIVLSAVKDGWITTHRHVPSPTQEKPSKIWPSARIWAIEGASQVIDLTPGITLKQSTKEHEADALVFEADIQGLGDPDIAKIKADILALHRWCVVNCGTDWKLDARQCVFSKLEVRDRGLAEVRGIVQFNLVLKVAAEYGPLVKLTFG